MNFDYPMPNLPEIPQLFPEKIMRLASTLPDVTISIPTVNKVLKAIEQGEADQVSNLEWIYCISAKEEWDNQNLNHSKETSSAIWQVAISNSWLQHQLIWRLALYCNGQKERILAKSLADSFEVFAINNVVKNLLKIKVILAIRGEHPGNKLAQIACEYNFNRAELINEVQADIPLWISGLSQLTEKFAPHFCSISYPKQKQVNWLLSCLNEMSDEQQIKAVNHLLINVSLDTASQHSQLVEWLRNNYRSGEKWYKLSELASKNLSDWIGAINYGDFQKLVDLILNSLPLKDFEENQLRRRREFWSDYSNRFEKIRILLPESSLKIIGNHLKSDIHVLKNDGSEPTEVCIFDFGDWIVVEFFRGKGSETRLLPNNFQNQQILFGQSQVSVKCIRCLGGDRHDHVFLWQVFSRIWLQNHGIIPNLDNQPSNQPTADKLRDRNYRLQQWRRDIEDLEREAKAHCNRIGC